MFFFVCLLRCRAANPTLNANLFFLFSKHGNGESAYQATAMDWSKEMRMVFSSSKRTPYTQELFFLVLFCYGHMGGF